MRVPSKTGPMPAESITMDASAASHRCAPRVARAARAAAVFSGAAAVLWRPGSSPLHAIAATTPATATGLARRPLLTRR
jgi:hypothetical protein